MFKVFPCKNKCENQSKKPLCIGEIHADLRNRGYEEMDPSTTFGEIRRRLLIFVPHKTLKERLKCDLVVVPRAGMYLQSCSPAQKFEQVIINESNLVLTDGLLMNDGSHVKFSAEKSAYGRVFMRVIKNQVGAIIRSGNSLGMDESPLIKRCYWGVTPEKGTLFFRRV